MGNLSSVCSRRCLVGGAAATYLALFRLPVECQAAEKTEDKAREKPEDEPVYDLNPGIIAPQVIHQVVPEYSGAGFRLNATVLLRLVVSSKGLVAKADVVRGVARDVDDCAIKAVKEWRFRPATKDGKPVAVRVEIEIRFNDL